MEDLPTFDFKENIEIFKAYFWGFRKKKLQYMEERFKEFEIFLWELISLISKK